MTYSLYKQNNEMIEIGMEASENSMTCLLYTSFNDWKNGFSKLKEHENSINHRNSLATRKKEGV